MKRSGTENNTKIPALTGTTVIKTTCFDDGPFDSGWKIFFSNGSILTAQDGEYGDDAFAFVKEDINDIH